MKVNLRAGKGEKSWFARKFARLRLFEPPFGEEATNEPEIIVFPSASGEGCDCVRIFVGTSSSLYRAIRVLIWSIMAVKDPEIRYEIRLISNLKGLPRKGWKTGYEGYRTVIPKLAGGVGRAIYCDARTIFLSDPAELFDLPMDKALLENSEPGAPALMDCGRLHALWKDVLDPAVKPPHHEAVDARISGSDRARLPERWLVSPDLATEPKGVLYYAGNNAPWDNEIGAPFERDSAFSRKWQELEDAANAAGYMPFVKDRPTREFGELIELYCKMHDDGHFPGDRLKHHVDPILELIGQTGARTLLDYGAGKAEGYRRVRDTVPESPMRHFPQWPDVDIRCYDPGVAEFSVLEDGDRFDGVISTDVVEHLSPLDVPWILDEMFSRAGKFVFVVAACYPAMKILPDGRNAHTVQESEAWWRDQMKLAGMRYPEIMWSLGCDHKNWRGKRTRFFKSWSA